MDELRKDPTRGQWSLIRPKGPATADSGCRYCPGAEHLGGREIAAYRKDGSLANEPGWTIRVVPEPDAYFRIEHELVREGVGMFDMITPRGASELIVESPNHDDTLASMEGAHMPAPLQMLDGIKAFPCGCGRDWGCFEVYTTISGLPYLLAEKLKKFPNHELATAAGTL